MIEKWKRSLHHYNNLNSETCRRIAFLEQQISSWRQEADKVRLHSGSRIAIICPPTQLHIALQLSKKIELEKTRVGQTEARTERLRVR